MNFAELTEEEIYELSEFFKNLSDYTRVNIITVLINSEKCVQEISEEIGMSQTAVSYQLRILRHAHLVKARKSGKMVYYQLADSHVTSILKTAIEHLEHN